MDGRQNRIIIPSAVALVAIGVTLLLADGGTILTGWFGGENSKNFPEFLVKAGVVSVGVGYLCHALFVLYTFLSSSCRFVDFSKLLHAFGLKYKNGNLTRGQQRALEEHLLDEFHLRLHSHAPQTLIGFCSRRNTAWYISITSGIASVIGWLVAVIFILARYNCINCGSFLESGIILAVIVFYLVFVLRFSWVLCHEAASWMVIVSGFLVIVAILVLIALIITLCDSVIAETCIKLAGLVVASIMFAVLIPLGLFFQGVKWNQEFWGVCWKWIYWDRQTNSSPENWLEQMMPDKKLPGVEWITEEKRGKN